MAVFSRLRSNEDTSDCLAVAEVASIERDTPVVRDASDITDERSRDGDLSHALVCGTDSDSEWPAPDALLS